MLAPSLLPTSGTTSKYPPPRYGTAEFREVRDLMNQQVRELLAEAKQ